MEDSFDDFQEKKKIKTGPKIVPKDKKNKKSLKRSKGQKDIRSLIKKNELVSYSQDFDQVCKQSGVDVDSEQLQLAIALSKSLNEVQSCSEDVEIQNKQMSSQERTAKIRTTLQEYGFKTNNKKILLSLPSTKRKKYSKHSKLLQISNEKRQQEVSNKYFEVLASNICELPNIESKCVYSKHTIFYKATNIRYENIKNNDLFYVNDLIDKATHKTCLLRDWSEIPGRPASPKPIHSDVKFEAIQFSQDELDHVLSGSIDKAQIIVNSKSCVREKIIDNSSYNYISLYNNSIDIIEPIPSCSYDSKNNQVDEVTQVQILNNQDIEKSTIKNSIQKNIECVDLINSVNENNCSQKSLNVIHSQNLYLELRSASPDLFDDEVCSIIEDKNDFRVTETNRIKQKEVSVIENKNHNETKNITKYDSCTIFMDLTECANNISNNFTDLTKRRSNDVMDITECLKPKNIDVTLGSDEANKNMVEKNEELIDLTQVSNLIQCLPEIEKSVTKTVSIEIDDTVIYDVSTKTVNNIIDFQEPILLLDESITKDIMNGPNSNEYDILNSNNSLNNENDANSRKIIENVVVYDEFGDKNNDINIDLTQGSEHSGESSQSVKYPEFIDDCRSGTEHNSGTLNNDNDEDNDVISLKSVSFNDIENQDEDIDLTQDSEKSFEITEENYAINGLETSYKGFNNFDYNVGTTDNENNRIISVENIHNDECVEENEDDKIDLTQVVEENKEKSNASDYVYKNNSKLGKIDNISIDYDEMFDEITSEAKNVSKHTFKSNISDKDNSSNPSINSEVFEISDKELNYSIHHSIHETFDENTKRFIRNRSLSDSYVATVNISKPLTPIKEKNSQTDNPIKVNSNQDAIIKTPKNNDYIIKTREVTPMGDYESMTSPERNKELEKYGIKPFKRKRAIQLLTYVYNQTHPVIESCSEEGPSKRLKIDNKRSSPKKKLKSPKKCLDFGTDVNKENDIFVVTKETPDIKNIECDPNEWVFQNREKAKVHSCRVPLHIAFHNYVSCRRLLREAILRYEPVNIDIIHKELVSYGHKYNPKDLLKFMDRKCITVKTVENYLRNKKV